MATVLFSNSFDGGTNGTAITTANSGGASGNAFSTVDGGVFDSTHAHSGALSGKCAGGNQDLWFDDATTSVTSYIRFYLYVTAYPSGNNAIRLCTFSAYNDNGYCGIVYLQSNGTIGFAPGSTESASFATAVPVTKNQWVRVEAKLVVKSTAEVRLFNTADSTTADSDVSGASSTSDSAQCGEWRFGIRNDGSGTFTAWVDDLAVAYDGWIGPSGPPPAQGAAPTTVASTASVGSPTVAGLGGWSRVAESSGTTTATLTGVKPNDLLTCFTVTPGAATVSDDAGGTWLAGQDYADIPGSTQHHRWHWRAASTTGSLTVTPSRSGRFYTACYRPPLSTLGDPGGGSVIGPMGVPSYDHIVLLMNEDHNRSDIVGNAPYLDSLRVQGADFTNSSGIDHPSMGNYLCMYAGSDFGWTTDDYTNLGAHDTIATTMIGHGGQINYCEDLPADPTAPSGNYVPRHNAAPYFSNEPAGTDLDFAANFPTTAAGFAALPAVSFIAPNLQHDWHDGTIAQADTWAQTNLSAYVDWCVNNNSLFIMTCDETLDYGINGPIYTFFYGAHVQQGSYSEAINHFTVLRTILAAFNLDGINNTAGLAPITDCWSTT